MRQFENHEYDSTKTGKLIKSVGSQERLPLEVSDYVGIRREKSEVLIIFGC